MLFTRSKKDKLFYRIMIDITVNIVNAAQLFRQNVETLQDKVKYSEQMKELELKGDAYTHQLIKELHKTFVTPLDHEDIYQLISHMDDVIDGMEACTARFVYFHVKNTTPYLVQFAENVLECAHHLHHAFVALEKKNYEEIREISIKINNLENEGDRLLRESIGSLFGEPVDVVELIKMKEIYEKLEYITDAFEDVMDIMESVVMKYA